MQLLLRTGRAVVRYQINDAAQTFLSYSTGYKSGGFDSLEPATSDNPLEPEETTNYEWGIKGDFFNRRLVTEFALYYMEIDGRQRSVYSKPPGQANATPIVINGDQLSRAQRDRDGPGCRAASGISRSVCVARLGHRRSQAGACASSAGRCLPGSAKRGR